MFILKNITIFYKNNQKKKFKKKDNLHIEKKNKNWQIYKDNYLKKKNYKKS